MWTEHCCGDCSIASDFDPQLFQVCPPCLLNSPGELTLPFLSTSPVHAAQPSLLLPLPAPPAPQALRPGCTCCFRALRSSPNLSPSPVFLALTCPSPCVSPLTPPRPFFPTLTPPADLSLGAGLVHDLHEAVNLLRGGRAEVRDAQPVKGEAGAAVAVRGPALR